MTLAEKQKLLNDQIPMVYAAGYIKGQATGGDTEDAWDEGYNVGYEVGYNNGLDDGYSDGYDDGYSEGWLDGNDVGYDEGYNRGYDNAIYDICPMFEERGNAVMCFPMDEMKVEAFLDEGATATVTRCGKNLFDKNNYTRTECIPGTGNFSSTAHRSVVVEVIPNTTYTVKHSLPTIMRLGTSVEFPSSGDKVSVYVARNTSTGGALTITTGENDRWMVVQLLANADVNNGITLEQCIESLQVEFGNVATSYEPYNGETFAITDGETIHITALDGVNCLTIDNDGIIEVSGYANPNELLDYVMNEIIALGAYI